MAGWPRITGTCSAYLCLIDVGLAPECSNVHLQPSGSGSQGQGPHVQHPCTVEVAARVRPSVLVLLSHLKAFLTGAVFARPSKVLCGGPIDEQ